MTRTPTKPDAAAALPDDAEFLTFEQFLQSPRFHERVEWVDGKLSPMHSVLEPHDRLSGFLSALLEPYVRHAKLGRLFHEPYLMRLPDQQAARSPDMFFVKAARVDLVTRECLRGPADLAIEIVSPDSRQRDRVHKFAEYELAGIPEYWILDPDERRADFFRHGADGRYARVDTDAGVYTTDQLPAMRLNVEWLWQSEPPDPIAVLRDWGVV